LPTFAILKNFVAILLLTIISVSHLNLLDAICRFTDGYKPEKVWAANSSNTPLEEEHQKDVNKNKAPEEEKFLHKGLATALMSDLSNKEKFICFCTALQKHPYQETDIQPPNAA